MTQLSPTVSVEVAGSKIIITCDISGPGVMSKSGKSKVYATTSGNKNLQDGYVLGLNLYKSI